MTSHELNRLFDTAGMPLCRKLHEMLDEHPSHRTVRRGCGLTQSTRFLSVYINTPRNPEVCDELGMFDRWQQRKHVTELAHQACIRGWPHGWRGMLEAPESLHKDLQRSEELAALIKIERSLIDIGKQVELPENRIVLDLMRDLMSPVDDAKGLPSMAQKPQIGSCSQAEEFFLEIAHGKIRRGGHVNVIIDADGKPVMIEKVDLGESHSAIVLRPCRLNGVTLVPGSLVALSYPQPPAGTPGHRHGCILPDSALDGVYYMRLTTLGVTPDIRKRAFSVQFERQVSGNMLSPHSTTIDDLLATADRLVAGAA